MENQKNNSENNLNNNSNLKRKPNNNISNNNKEEDAEKNSYKNKSTNQNQILGKNVKLKKEEDLVNYEKYQNTDVEQSSVSIRLEVKDIHEGT